MRIPRLWSRKGYAFLCFGYLFGHLGAGCLIGNYYHIAVKLKDGGRKLRSNRTVNSLGQSVRLVLSADDEKDLFCLHNGSDTHGVSLLRNIIGTGKESLVGVNGAFGQVYAVGDVPKCIVRFVETDMAVAAKAQKL